MTPLEHRGPIGPNGLELRDAVDGELKIKDTDSKNREVLVFFPHEKVDTYRTTFAPECFEGSFRAEMPLMCWQHKLDEPIGRAISAQSTRAGNELVGKFSDFNAVPLAHRAFTQIDDGTITDFSFGFKDSKRRAHPDIRGVEQIYQATMKEFSPVSIGSIPGAKATGVRQEENGLMDGLSVEQILEMVRLNMIDHETGQRMIAKAVPELREHIRMARPPTADDIRAALEESHPELAMQVRGAAIELRPPGWEPEDYRGEADEDANELASACDTALDAAQAIFNRTDCSELTEEMQQGIALVHAAGAVADELLARLGVRDDDEDDDEDDDSDSDDDSDDDEGKRPFKGAAPPFKKGHAPRRDDEVEYTREAELEAYRKDFSAAKRRQLAKEGKALPDGSYPIETKEDLDHAAILAKSGHGNVAAAKRHIAKRAKELGVKNPMEDDDGRSDEVDDEARAQQIIERRLQPAGR